ncbi:MAG: hypothetical protein JSV71_00685 [Nitrospiraceae bacterium]|nr:MAG: hypothetical protein JSV71_00685 [Nitrospiraceae bacterium]
MSKFLILFLIVIYSVLLSLSADAAYRVHLKSGRVISEVEEITREAGKVKIVKSGITLDMNEDSIDKIEEYEMEDKGDEIRQPVSSPDDELPEYMKFDEKEYEEILREEEERIFQLKEEYYAVLWKLERIEELEVRSKELESRIYKSLRLLSPRKARFARREKAEVDKALGELKKEEEYLLDRKKRLERALNIRDGYEPSEQGEDLYGEEGSEEMSELPYDDIRYRYPGLFNESEFGPKIQLKNLNKQEQEGALPERFEPYKNFLDEQYKHQGKGESH